MNFVSLLTEHFASQFGLRTLVSFLFRGLEDLPVGFPYRFNSSFNILSQLAYILADVSCRFLYFFNKSTNGRSITAQLLSDSTSMTKLLIIDGSFNAKSRKYRGIFEELSLVK